MTAQGMRLDFAGSLLVNGLQQNLLEALVIPSMGC